MNINPRAVAVQDEEKIRRLIFVRLVVATLVVGAAIILLQAQSRELSAVALYSLLGVIYLSTGAVYLGHLRGAAFSSLVRLLIGIDLAVLTLIVHYSGGSESIFTNLYILTIFVGGFYFQVAGGLVTSLLAATLYTIYTLLELKGVVRSPEGAILFTHQNLFDSLINGYIHLAVFVSSGLISGYFSRRILSSREILADREKQIKQIQVNNDYIFRNMSSGLVVLNLESEIISMNPAARRILGVCEGIDVEGKPFNAVIDGMDRLLKELVRVRESGVQRKRHEIELVKPDGKELPLGISISLLTSGTGQKMGVIALFQDLTEVHMMRKKIRKADKLAAVGEISAAIAHEIRAPLASICGSTEMLKQELDVDEENMELMDLIIRESDRLDGMITEFLEYSKMRRPEFESVNIENCLKETVMLIKHGSHLKDSCSLTFEAEGAGIRVFADEQQIRQVFLNIALNACQAVDCQGNINIDLKTVRKQAGNGDEDIEYAQIRFINDGEPISEEDRRQIFDPFFTTKEGGTGLGLATAARIVENHSGNIHVESNNYRTVFTLLLPLKNYEGQVGIKEIQNQFERV
ncbi:MAG: PAS domain-containing protein [Candidatus Latescibacteria bacterium]|nr:PAS domain-containing protein [bacterium]MBD3425393.1 PAS domain-containing protein [Candidatus Latescibacterota bacterium]